MVHKNKPTLSVLKATPWNKKRRENNSACFVALLVIFTSVLATSCPKNMFTRKFKIVAGKSKGVKYVLLH
jgi:hypothetical protein